jgi:hypothetical protein
LDTIGDSQVGVSLRTVVDEVVVGSGRGDRELVGGVSSSILLRSGVDDSVDETEVGVLLISTGVASVAVVSTVIATTVSAILVLASKDTGNIVNGEASSEGDGDERRESDGLRELHLMNQKVGW